MGNPQRAYGGSADPSAKWSSSSRLPTGIDSATGPFTSPTLECSGAAAVDEGLDQREDGPLDGRSNEDLLEVVLAFERRRGVGLLTGGGPSPDLLEDDLGHETAHY